MLNGYLLENKYLFLIYLFLLNISHIHCQCSSEVEFSELNVAFQQEHGTSKTSSFAHTLTSSQISKENEKCSKINSGLILTNPTATCPLECLTALTPYKYTNESDIVDIVMMRDIDKSLYPGYVEDGVTIYCVKTNGNCGATMPFYGYHSSNYYDHITSTDNTMPDNTYNVIYSGYPICYGWKMPSEDIDKISIAEKYDNNISDPCNVMNYLGLTSLTTLPPTTTNDPNTTESLNSSTVPSSESTVITTSAGQTDFQSTDSLITTTILPVTVILTDSSGVPITDSSGNPVTATVPTVDEGNNENEEDKGDNDTWKWVVLGIGLGVFVLAILALLFFFFSNFTGRKPTKARINPYDRDLYTNDGMGEAPPVPVNAMPTQGPMAGPN